MKFALCLASAFGLALILSSCGKQSDSENVQAESKMEDSMDDAKSGGEMPKKADLEKAANKEFSLDEFKGWADSMSTDGLKKIGETLMDSLKSNEGMVDDLKKELSGLSLSDLTKTNALKDKMSGATELVSSLQEKLDYVKGKLSEMGVDVAKMFE